MMLGKFSGVTLTQLSFRTNNKQNKYRNQMNKTKCHKKQSIKDPRDIRPSLT